MEVFSPSWIEVFSQRYGNMDNAPPLYHLATSDECKSNRDAIQQWVDKLPEYSQQKLVTKLRNPRSFLQTYNELKIASLLFSPKASVFYPYIPSHKWLGYFRSSLRDLLRSDAGSGIKMPG